MTQVHLSDKRLQALYDGEPGTHWEREHLVSCPVCQQAFDDTLWMGLLIRLQKAERIEGPHPSRDELLAYRTRALPEAVHPTTKMTAGLDFARTIIMPSILLHAVYCCRYNNK